MDKLIEEYWDKEERGLRKGFVEFGSLVITDHESLMAREMLAIKLHQMILI